MEMTCGRGRYRGRPRAGRERDSRFTIITIIHEQEHETQGRIVRDWMILEP